jgi:hypothetical protein
MLSSPEFRTNPIGITVDPELLVLARGQGTSVEELHRRAYAGEFSPAAPLDLRLPDPEPDRGSDGGAIAGVIARMQEIDGSLPRKDGVAYFNRLYLQVTKAVLAASEDTSFEDPRFLELLDVTFAGLYFDAESTITTGAPAPVAWRPLIEQRSEPRAPIQFVLAGMDAHINHDLALAVVRTCLELAIAPEDDTAAHRDYERVNSMLKTVETQVAGWFDTGVIADLEDVIPLQVDNALAMWSIVTARELAWDKAKVIWMLQATPELAQSYADVLARTTELSARAILI